MSEIHKLPFSKTVDDRPVDMTTDERIEWQARRIRQLEAVMDDLLMWGEEQYIQDWDEDTVAIWLEAEEAFLKKPKPVKI